MGIAASSNKNTNTDSDTNEETLDNSDMKTNLIIEEPKKVDIMEREPITETVVMKTPNRELMEKLEKEGMDKVAGLSESGKAFDMNSLMDIINEGQDEFKKKEGRNMTYAEMRSLYG